jgi:DNA-binding NarL/FixJ family response regulator
MMSFVGSAPAVRVFVVDDSLPFREATRSLIEATGGFRWVGEACCGEDALKEVARLNPDLVLMDVRMPGIGGIGAAKAIAARNSPSIVVLITGADLATDVPDGVAAEIVPKGRLNPASLRRLWQAHGRRPE